MTEGCAPYGKVPSEARRKRKFPTLYSIKILITILLFLIGLNGNKYYINPYIIVLYRSLVGFGFFMLGKYSFKYIKK